MCSTIIETGIDVPTANTIIIERADRFGLAQLHQLRGRVGRSHHQAYAYLLTPPEEALSAQAKKRLEAIQMMEDLGSGFYLAMHDLEIRGAGEVLGESQSGEMQEVGFQLYADMLKPAVRALKAGREPDLAAAARRHHRDQPARAGAAAGRLLQRRARAARALQAARELRDAGRAHRDAGGARRPLRPPARPAQALLACHRLRILGKPLGVARIDATPDHVQIQFGPHATVDPGRVIELVQKHRGWRLLGPTKLRAAIRRRPSRSVPSRRGTAGLARGVVRRSGGDAGGMPLPVKRLDKPVPCPRLPRITSMPGA